MTKFQVTITVVVAVMVLLVVGILASQVGGSSIRTSGQFGIGELVLSSYKVLPGVPVTMTYDLIDIDGVRGASIVMMRTPQESVVISDVAGDMVASGRITVEVPCSSEVYKQVEGNKASFVLVRNEDERVLAQSRVFTLLPPGPDCLY